MAVAHPQVATVRSYAVAAQRLAQQSNMMKSFPRLSSTAQSEDVGYYCNSYSVTLNEPACSVNHHWIIVVY